MVSIATAATWQSVSQKPDYMIFWHNPINVFNLNKMSENVCSVRKQLCLPLSTAWSELPQQSLTARHSTIFWCLMNWKGKSWNSVSIGVLKCFVVSKVTTRVWMLSFGTDTTTQSFCNSFIALSMIRCSKSSQKYAVQVCQVAMLSWKPHSWF